MRDELPAILPNRRRPADRAREALLTEDEVAAVRHVPEGACGHRTRLPAPMPVGIVLVVWLPWGEDEQCRRVVERGRRAGACGAGKDVGPSDIGKVATKGRFFRVSVTMCLPSAVAVRPSSATAL
ncbi:hypothetical protein ACFYZJ_32275 [Streptomyces sp. NPDC001848]|uniref:hypothetical protein n=1 Tax=Streptomyces sp. NPDC001848 TaxID=3364618 RepID=UPI0036B62500